MTGVVDRSPSVDAAATPRGTVHDLGYKRYVGTRLPQSSRWQVIMRQQISYAWKTWWRYKLAMVGAVIATLVSGAVMYIAADTLMRVLGRGRGGVAVKFVDGILPLSVMWYCKLGFIASMTVAASVITSDVRTGAFSFYFARPVRPWDYVVGKVVGLLALAALLVLAGPVLLALLRIGLADSPAQALSLLPNLPYAMLVGALSTLVYSVIPLGFSALVADRRWAIGFWALYYIAFGSTMSGLATVVWQPLAALDLAVALERISVSLFDLTFTGSAPRFAIGWGIGSILLHSAIAVAIVCRRVTHAARDGVGGAS
jgi:ABC-type multidrug transport system fused ATPase/permease subunit